LLDEPEWPPASFLLSVLGEGTFLVRLEFLERYAPEPVTARVARLVLQDEARHVAFSLGHLREHLAQNPAFREKLRAAILRRHEALIHSSGISPAVEDALVILDRGRVDT
jgi:hypothetical protein